MVIISGAYGKLKRWVKAQIATHKAVSDAHHSKYLDSEAVTAVATADDYVKNTGDTITGNYLTLEGDGAPGDGQIYFNNKVVGGRYAGESYAVNNVPLGWFGADSTQLEYWIAHGGWQRVFAFTRYSPYEILAYKTLNLQDNIIKNPKNHVHSALSGVKKLVEIDIGGTPYYFEVYPTKA